jgi:hypothetical protein
MVIIFLVVSPVQMVRVAQGGVTPKSPMIQMGAALGAPNKFSFSYTEPPSPVRLLHGTV